MFVRIAIAIVFAMSIPVSTVLAAGCDYSEWRSYEETQLYRSDTGTSYFWITSRAAVDADGAPNAYHPDDVGKPCGATGAGLDCPSNAGYPGTTWWRSVLAADPQHPDRAFVAPSGFFVSMTTLADGDNPDPRDPARYVDAASIPYVVFPGPFNRVRGTGLMGDIGVAFHLRTGKITPFIVADVGPDEGLGEASVALFAALGGHKPNPRTGGGVAPGKVLYMMFPRSVQARPDAWPLTAKQIGQLADALLAKVGGEATIKACAAAHP